jgi:hypothetical protein
MIGLSMDDALFSITVTCTPAYFGPETTCPEVTKLHGISYLKFVFATFVRISSKDTSPAVEVNLYLQPSG